jgi:ankyrin repeat protein
MTDQPKKQYKSTGAMLKAGDFEALLEDLQQKKDSGDLSNFNKRTSQKPISEFDDLLFFLPQYAVKYAEVEENGDKKMVMTSELQPGALEALKFCLENGANPNAYMKNGENTYLKACEIPTSEILDYLINNPYNKVDLNHTDGMGNTGLFYATMAESTQVMEYLVKTVGFDVNAKNFLSDDQTVLHYACGHGKEKSIDKLMELGANPTIKSAYGYIPHELMLPAYDEETIEEMADEPEELAKWALLYDKVVKITEDYKIANPPKLKTKFK